MNFFKSVTSKAKALYSETKKRIEEDQLQNRYANDQEELLEKIRTG